MLKLRDYQQATKDQIYERWNAGQRNVAAVLPTGAGKTVLFGSIINDRKTPSVAIAHRKELVSQIALALARYGVPHQVIGPAQTIKDCVNLQLSELGTSFYQPSASCAVAGVDTLINREESLRHWTHQVGLVVTDECHHVLKGNKWGTACSMFPNALQLGVTATLCRADGKGLGAKAHGIYDTFVEGPNMRDLINSGFLAEYRIVAPPSDMDLSSVGLSAGGDFSPPQLKKAARKSHIVGDVVLHYLNYAAGGLGIVFATDVETATDIKHQFVARGVAAEVVSAKSPTAVRTTIIQRFRKGELKVLVNVDLFGEGFDLPAVEVVSMARPTESYGLYAQQFGRALRLSEGKDKALIIDHVGNVQRHGLPDKPRVWSLDARDKTPRMANPDDDIPLRYCVECTAPYERALVICPYCGTGHVPELRSGPEYVDGDLVELDAATLAEMRGDVRWVDMEPDAVYQHHKRSGKSEMVARSAAKNQGTRKTYQTALRESIAWWAAFQQQKGRDDRESYRRFYLTFKIDVLSAQALGKNEALALANKVNDFLARC